MCVSCQGYILGEHIFKGIHRTTKSNVQLTKINKRKIYSLPVKCIQIETISGSYCKLDRQYILKLSVRVNGPY